MILFEGQKMQENEQKRPSYTYCSSPQMWHIFQKQQQGEQIPIFLPPNFYNKKIPSWFYVLTSTLEAQKAEHQRELLQHVLQITFWTAQNPLRQNCEEGYKTHKSSKFEVAIFAKNSANLATSNLHFNKCFNDLRVL